MYNIAVMMKQKTTSIPPTTTFFIRGTVDNEANVIQATRGLIDCLTASFGGNALVRPSLVSTQMEISPQHHTFIQGKNELLVKQVSLILNENCRIQLHVFKWVVVQLISGLAGPLLMKFQTKKLLFLVLLSFISFIVLFFQ